MGLKIRKISCENFRSYQHFVLEDIGDTTLIIGPNAAGKTNLIEGMQLLTALSSFRKPRPGHLVREGADFARFAGTIIDGNRMLKIELRANQEARTFTLNSKKKRPQDLRGILPSVLFCPDDLELVKGSQSAKRAALDHLGNQVSANYHAVRKDYEKILKQKNRYLKEEVSPAYLQSINEVQASIGAQFYRLRATMVEALIPYIKECYKEISQGREQVDISYVPSWLRHDVNLERYRSFEIAGKDEARESLMNAMEQDSHREHERRIALFGPQVDRVEFYLDGKNASIFASQGQQRSLVLSYKMAEVALLRDRIGYPPILLLDDVMSELDKQRRSALMSLVSSDVQTFITATNSEYFDEAFLHSAKVVTIGGETDGGHL